MITNYSPVQQCTSSPFFGNTLLGAVCPVMTDKKWEESIKKAVSALHEALRLREIAEQEYESRFKHHPSDVDDDFWIDCVHLGQGQVDIKRLIENAKSCHA